MLSCQVVWRYNGAAIDDLGENILIRDWIPQQDLLFHKNTKLFITHGGSHGM